MGSFRQPAKRAAGCVVYRDDGAGGRLILLIHDKYGSWTLPKGHLEPGEDEQAAAIREVFEETGIMGVLGPLVATIAYEVLTRKGERRDKRVTFFLMRAAMAEIIPQADEGIGAADWFMPAAAAVRIGYPQVRDVLVRALQMLE
jgi:8-oxo-dGTP diphosphatase